MPEQKGPKLVACSICGEQVSKRSTLAVGGGKRACRAHSETMDKSEQKQAADEAERERRLKEQEQRLRAHRTARTAGKSFVPRCWICKKEGLHQTDFFLRALKSMEKCRLAHAGRLPNIFDPEQAKEIFGAVEGNICLWVIPYTDDLKRRLGKLFGDPEQRFAAEIAGAIMLCPHCVEKHKVEIKHRKFQNIDEMVLFGSAMGAVISKWVQDQAVRELARDN